MGIKYSKKKRTLLKIYFLFHSYSPAVQSAFIRAKENRWMAFTEKKSKSDKRIAFLTGRSSRRLERREEKRRRVAY